MLVRPWLSTERSYALQYIPLTRADAVAAAHNRKGRQALKASCKVLFMNTESTGVKQSAAVIFDRSY